MTDNVFKRLAIYIFIAIFYLYFMSLYAPLGSNWLEWHFQRMYNFSEYLSINGYFSNYGFSIWNKCVDCPSSAENLKDRIYLTSNFFSHFPYVLINDFFGSSGLKFFGSLLDKTLIVLSGFLISQLYIKLSKSKKNNFLNFNISLLIFIFFITNPWTYKMFLHSTPMIYFIFFFLLSVYMFLIKKETLGLTCLFISGLFDYQSAAGLFVFYSLLLIFRKYQKNKDLLNNFFPPQKKNNIKFVTILLLPVVIFFTLRFLALNNLNNIVDFGGSSLLTRIGISGNDLYNGGILGALQFMGGNRITQCLMNFNTDINSMNLSQKIYIFNCTLSIISMFLISAISILGLLYLSKSKKKYFDIIILPLAFLFLSYTFILQQSSSVHLMGYSYFFSILYSIGMASLILKILEKYKFSITSILLATPITLGIISLCIRVSMLTGANG